MKVQRGLERVASTGWSGAAGPFLEDILICTLRKRLKQFILLPFSYSASVAWQLLFLMLMQTVGLNWSTGVDGMAGRT